MAGKGLTKEELKHLHDEAFAPMIRNIGIETDEITGSGARFLVPASDFIMRTGEIVCGQAIASIADTVGVMTLFAHNEERRYMTTVDMTTHFMRPLSSGLMEVEATILSNGRRMATVRVETRQQGTEKTAATTTCAYAYI